MNTNIGALIKERRIELGFTMTEFAKLLDVNAATVSRWENGNIKNMKRNHVANISKILNIPIDALMGWSVPEEDRSMAQLMAYYKMLAKDQQKELLNYAKYLKQKGDDF